MANKKARVIAYYLPQFHPTPENDKFWGKGFTEWTNVGRARPLFHGHYQPRVPADLGYYDLRMPEIREQQAELAREAGIEGFCYWHYWFGGGKELLERPFNEVVESGKPDFPFCLGWANHTWSTRTWTSSKTGYQETIIAEMTYPGDEDHISHFYKYLNAFKDKRYIKVDGKLLFVIFAPQDFVDFPHFKDLCLKSATKLFSVLLASKRPLITELADKLRLKYPLLPTISPCPTMRLEAIRSIIPISCRRYPKSV